MTSLKTATMDRSVLAQLEKLPLDQQRALLAHLDHKFSGSTRSLSGHQEDVLEALRRVTGTRQASTEIIAAVGKRRFDDAVETLDAYLERASSRSLRRPQRLAMLTLVLRCLASAIDQWADFEVTPKTLLLNLHRLPGAVNRRFPGYAGARLLDSVVGSLTH